MEEIWKPVCGFEEKYYISSKGSLKNIQTDKILKMTNKYGDYFSVVLYLNEKRIKSGYYGTQEHLKNRKNKKCSPRKQYKIYQYSTNMEFIAKYNSSKEASKHTGVCSRNILHCINHKEGRTQAGGFKWIKESEVVNCEKSI